MTTFVATLNIPQPASAQESTPEVSPYVPDGYHFVVGDEFQGTELDRAKWDYRYVDRKYQAGFNTAQAITLPGDDYLHLVTTYHDEVFYTGMIQSVQQFQYGYFEARIQFQTLQGHHGAFWLQSPLYGKYQDDPARSGAEIDIIEFFGNGRSTDAEQNIYWNEYKTRTKATERSNELHYRKDNGLELSRDFHVFALWWTSTAYVFYIDGVETWRTSDGLSETPEYIVLSLITSDWENERLITSKLPDEMRVDYVRVYAPRIQ